MDQVGLTEARAKEWVRDYSDELFGFVFKRVRDQAVAEDLLQETFLAAWRNRATYDAKQSARTWLFHILRNKLIDYYRTQSQRSETPMDDADWNGEPFFDQAGHWASNHYPADINWEAAAALNTKDFMTVFHDCQGRLVAKQFAVFQMKYLDDLSSDEICTALGISSANYWVLLHRAKTQLRACLETLWFNQKK